MISKIFKGLAVSYIFTFIAFIIFAFILRFTNVSESSTPGITLLISILSILSGAAYCTKNASSQGWLWGGCVGGMYAVIIYLISSIAITGFTLPLMTFYLIGGYILIGAVGGIVGINI